MRINYLVPLVFLDESEWFDSQKKPNRDFRMLLN